MTKRILILIAACFFAVTATAEKAINASLTPDIAVYPKTENIKGLTLSIWGENEQKALALGFVHGSTGDSAGLSLGLFNYSENYTGVQWAFVNYNKTSFVGWQGGAVNYSEGSVKGLQTGFVNYAAKMTGLQLGFVNYAKVTDDAVQIGLANIINDNERWFNDFPDQVAPAMIFLNWSF